jgi:protein-tyrosine phosphatase
LLEFPWKKEQYPADAPHLVSWLKRQGMTPIVAHPERQSFFEEKPKRLRALIDTGAWLQVTVGFPSRQPWANPSVNRREAAPILL